MIAERRAVYPPLTGGLNYRQDALSLRPNEAGVIRNCHIDANGIASTRRGLRKINDVALDGAITGIQQYSKPSAGTMVRTVIITTPTTIYEWTSGTTFTGIGNLTATDRPSMVNFLDGTSTSVILIANGTDFYMYDGSTVANATAGFQSTSNPRYLTVFDNRLAASGCDDDPNAVFMSALRDCGTWGATDYFLFESDTDRERVTGLGTMFSLLTVLKRQSVYVVTEGNPGSDTVKQVRVAQGFGTTSHWSVVTRGENIFFTDGQGSYRGRLSELVTDGMLVKKIGDKVKYKWADGQDYDVTQGIYDLKSDTIMWGLRLVASDKCDCALVFNPVLSVFDSSTAPDDPVWSSVFDGTGFRFYTAGSVINSSGVAETWVGDEDGYVYVLGEDTQEDDATETIETEIGLAHIAPFGHSMRKFFTVFTPLLYQKTNETTDISFTVDSSFLAPVTAVKSGTAAYWSAGISDAHTQSWGTTVWKDRPMLPYLIDVKRTGYFILPWIFNDDCEIAYGGGEMFFQPLGKRR